MKYKSKTTLLVISILLILFSISGVKGQEYGYFNTLIPDATYEWEVTSLVTTGYDSLSYLAFGDDELEQGDKISIKILANVSEITNGDPYQLFNISNTWIEFYLNGENKTTDPYEIGIIDLTWTNWVGFFFLLPVTYENETGVFNYFEVINEAFPTINEEEKTETTMHAYYEYDYDKIKQTSKLSQKTWTVSITSNSQYKEEDRRDPENWYKEDTTIDTFIELRFNVETGLLVYLQYDYNWHSITEVEGSVDDDTRSVNLLIQSTVLPTAPFSWLFGLIGVIVIGLIIRKRRK